MERAVERTGKKRSEDRIGQVKRTHAKAEGNV